MMLAAAAQKACENRKHITLRPACCETRNKPVGTRTVVGARYILRQRCTLQIIALLFASLRPYSSCASTPTPGGVTQGGVCCVSPCVCVCV